MIQRIENKKENEIELDRRLLEQVGSSWEVNGEYSKPNLEEIQKLLSKGAQSDHWVEDEYGNYYNAIMSAVRQESEASIEVFKTLIERNRTFRNRDRGRFYESPLGYSIRFRQIKKAIMIIKTKAAINPIFSFLAHPDCSFDGQSKDEKMEILQEISENYDFKTVIKSDLSQIFEDGKFGDEYVQTNLNVIFEFCESKGKFSNEDYENCFDLIYSPQKIVNPIFTFLTKSPHGSKWNKFMLGNIDRNYDLRNAIKSDVSEIFDDEKFQNDNALGNVRTAFEFCIAKGYIYFPIELNIFFQSGGKNWEPLSFLFRLSNSTEKPEDPVFLFLTEKRDESRDQKLALLAAIEKIYHLQNVLQKDLIKTRELGKLAEKDVQENLLILFQYCKANGADFIPRVFGQSYSIKRPISWRYKDGKSYRWLTEFFPGCTWIGCDTGNLKSAKVRTLS